MTINLIAPKNKEDWHPIWQQCYPTIKNLGYPVKIWDYEAVDSEIESDNKDFFKVLDELPPIFKYDYVRYIILERYGGMYMDMDIEVVNDFIPMLDKERCYIMGGQGGEYLQNSIMVAGGDWLKPMWNRLKWFCRDKVLLNGENNKSNPRQSVVTTGPRALSEFFIKYCQESQHNQKVYEILAPEHFQSLDSTITFTRHHHTSLWAHN